MKILDTEFPLPLQLAQMYMFYRFLMKYELTKKGAMLARPIKSSNASPPIVTSLHSPKVLPDTAQGGSPTVRPTANVTTGKLLNIGVVSTSTIYQNFG